MKMILFRRRWGPPANYWANSEIYNVQLRKVSRSSCLLVKWFEKVFWLAKSLIERSQFQTSHRSSQLIKKLQKMKRVIKSSNCPTIRLTFFSQSSGMLLSPRAWLPSYFCRFGPIIILPLIATSNIQNDLSIIRWLLRLSHFGTMFITFRFLVLLGIFWLTYIGYDYSILVVCTGKMVVWKLIKRIPYRFHSIRLPFSVTRSLS